MDFIQNRELPRRGIRLLENKDVASLRRVKLKCLYISCQVQRRIRVPKLQVTSREQKAQPELGEDFWWVGESQHV